MELEPIAPTAQAPAERFTGHVYVTPLHTPREPSRLIASLVRFTPGARTNWHSHHLGQALYCTEGVGIVATRDGTVLRLRAGDTVWTPPGEEHWHGATASNVMCHHALLEGTGDDDGTTWLEPVTDAEYQRAQDA
jgi:quercetin dioxygenase-like cupin family protein